LHFFKLYMHIINYSKATFSRQEDNKKPEGRSKSSNVCGCILTYLK
jgi:hypothetical protein